MIVTRFTVSPGVVTGFLGPKGSGKSTTMRMVLGLDRPDAGSALVNGCADAELSWPSSIVAVDRQPNSLSVTIGVVLVLVCCAVALGLGGALLDRRDA